ncbi:MAG: hypothetical protein K2X82_33965 [Gemmataceae bacterium]|nr:hypothetical protein [Gemmataceae bacterium]
MNTTSRPLRAFYLALCVAAFGLNLGWEMAQMSGFAQTAGRPWRETLRTCTVAALGDVALTAAVVGLGTLAAGSRSWPTAGRWNVYLFAAVLGAVCALAFEWFARATGRWSYSGAMPVVPVLEAGLWPFLQLTLLVPACVWVARWWTR